MDIVEEVIIRNGVGVVVASEGCRRRRGDAFQRENRGRSGARRVLREHCFSRQGHSSLAALILTVGIRPVLKEVIQRAVPKYQQSLIEYRNRS